MCIHISFVTYLKVYLFDLGLCLFSSVKLTLVDIVKLFSKVIVLIHKIGLLEVSLKIYIQKHLHTHEVYIFLYV